MVLNTFGFKFHVLPLANIDECFLVKVHEEVWYDKKMG